MSVKFFNSFQSDQGGQPESNILKSLRMTREKKRHNVKRERERDFGDGSVSIVVKKTCLLQRHGIQTCYCCCCSQLHI